SPRSLRRGDGAHRARGRREPRPVAGRASHHAGEPAGRRSRGAGAEAPLEEHAESRPASHPGGDVASMTPTRLEWSYNPWRVRPRQAALALVGALLCCLVVASWRLPGLVPGVLCVACVAALATACIPVSCRLDEEGVHRRSGWFAERRPWSALK